MSALFPDIKEGQKFSQSIGARKRRQESGNPGARFDRSAHGTLTKGNIDQGLGRKGDAELPFALNSAGNVFKRNLGGT